MASCKGDESPMKVDKSQRGVVQIIRVLGILAIEAWFLWFVSERLSGHSARDMLLWLSEAPGVVLLNFAMFFSVLGFLLFLTNRLDSACQLGLLLLALPVISAVKQSYLMEPLVPSDLALAEQAMSILPRYVHPMPAMMAGIAVVGSILLIGYALRKVSRMRFTISARLAGAVITVAAPAAIYASPAPLTNGLSGSRGSLCVGESSATSETYFRCGFAVSFLVRAGHSEWAMEPGYSETAMHAIAVSLPKPARLSTKVRPDVVAVLSESFWDPTELPGVEFSSDPLPTYHQLLREGSGRKFLSPSFGGGTANVEFELLTGFSMSLMPPGDEPYIDRLAHAACPSIARHFIANGYEARAIHSYDRKFYWRNIVYPYLGFGRFDGAETFSSENVKGMYISDAALCRHMEKELDQAKSPLFLFAVSMQNHGPYKANRYHQPTIRVNGAPEIDRAVLETYAEGTHDADAMLGRLVAYLKARTRPTVLIFFGDHLPSLGENLGIYTRTGMVQGMSGLEDRKKLHTTPAVVWANCPLELANPASVVSPNLVWSEVLPAIGMPHPFYSGFLGEIHDVVPGVSSAVNVLRDGSLSQYVPESIQGRVSQYRLIQYDVLGGEHFGMGEIFGLEQFAPPRAAGQ